MILNTSNTTPLINKCLIFQVRLMIRLLQLHFYYYNLHHPPVHNRILSHIQYPGAGRRGGRGGGVTLPTGQFKPFSVKINQKSIYMCIRQTQTCFCCGNIFRNFGRFFAYLLYAVGPAFSKLGIPPQPF